MKQKIIGLSLCVVLAAFFLCSCGKTQNTLKAEQNSGITKTASDEVQNSETTKNTSNAEKYKGYLDLMKTNSDSKYKLIDINGDDILELVEANENGRVIDIYSCADGKLVKCGLINSMMGGSSIYYSPGSGLFLHEFSGMSGAIESHIYSFENGSFQELHNGYERAFAGGESISWDGNDVTYEQLEENIKKFVDRSTAQTVGGKSQVFSASQTIISELGLGDIENQRGTAEKSTESASNGGNLTNQNNANTQVPEKKASVDPWSVGYKKAIVQMLNDLGNSSYADIYCYDLYGDGIPEFVVRAENYNNDCNVKILTYTEGKGVNEYYLNSYMSSPELARHYEYYGAEKSGYIGMAIAFSAEIRKSGTDDMYEFDISNDGKLTAALHCARRTCREETVAGIGGTHYKKRDVDIEINVVAARGTPGESWKVASGDELKTLRKAMESDEKQERTSLHGLRRTYKNCRIKSRKSGTEDDILWVLDQFVASGTSGASQTPAQNVSGEGSTYAAKGNFLVPDAATKIYDRSFFEAMDNATLRLARNEIIARHGRKFTSDDLKAYFDAQPWYHGTIEPDYFDANYDSLLGVYEKANIDAIRDVEEKRP